MKLINKLWLMAMSLLAFTACEKVGDLPFYGMGQAPVISSSANVIAPAPTDSMKPVVTLSWTNPKHASDSAAYKYVIEIDTAGGNFSKAASRVITGATSTTFLAKELNDIVLAMGGKFGQPVDIDVRVTSSYANNNEQLRGNTVRLKVTPYKIPPKVALPSTNRLFIVGNATDFDWTNPNPMPAVRELTRLNETTWAGIFNLSGTNEYLLLPQEGSWDNKYSVADKTLSGLANGGSFGFNLSDNFPGNVSGGAGWYNLVFDFQEGTYTATKVANALPEELYVTGDATASNWTNSPPDNQKFTQISNGLFEITVPLEAGKYYKFLGKKGEWQPQFGGSSATGGDFGANYGGGADPDAVPVQATSGNYKIQVNFHTQKYTVTKV